VSILPKALMVTASAAFVGGVSFVSIPKPPGFTPQERAPEAIDCRREPEKCRAKDGDTLAFDAYTTRCLTPAPIAASTQR